MGTTVVYTPQFVVGGVDPVAGPSAMDLADHVAAHRAQAGEGLRLVEGKVVLVAEAGEAALMLFEVLPEATVAIGAGENAGHEMTYHNVVVDVSPLGAPTGADRTIDLPVATRDDTFQVVVAQSKVDGKIGPVIGALALR
jgi:hypothetical protein